MSQLGVDRRLPLYEDRPRDIHFDVDNRRLKRELAFEFSWKFEAGLKESISYLESPRLVT